MSSMVKGLSLDQAIFLSQSRTAIWICVLAANSAEPYTAEDDSIERIRLALNTQDAYGYAIHILALGTPNAAPQDDRYSVSIARFTSTLSCAQVNLKTLGEFTSVLHDVEYLAVINTLGIRHISPRKGWLPK